MERRGPHFGNTISEFTPRLQSWGFIKSQHVTGKLLRKPSSKAIRVNPHCVSLELLSFTRTPEPSAVLYNTGKALL